MESKNLQTDTNPNQPDLMNHENRNFRSFAELHSDVWRLVFQYPLLFIVLPVIVWFPFDLLAEYVALKQGGGFVSQLKAYQQISRITSFFVGGWINAILFVAIYKIAHSEKVGFGKTLADGSDEYGKMLSVIFSFSWRVGLGLILFILPGIVLALRYALAIPVAIFEDVDGKTALEISSEYMKGKNWRLIFYLLIGLCIYVPGIIGLTSFAPEQETPLLNAVTTIPFNIFGMLFSVTLGLLYADATGNQEFKRPVRTPIKRTTFGMKPETSNLRASVVTAVVISLILFASGVYKVATAPLFPGEKMVFGSQCHEIYFHKKIDHAEVKKLGEALIEYGYFKGDYPQTVRLTTDEKGYKLYIIVIKDWWNDDDIIESLQYLQRHLSENVLSKSVTILMIDETFDGWDEMEVGRNDVQGI